MITEKVDLWVRRKRKKGSAKRDPEATYNIIKTRLFFHVAMWFLDYPSL